jgi:hypothetical protein
MCRRADGNVRRMSDKEVKSTREERLAAKLRENLRRRKSQAKAMGNPPGDGRETLSKSDSGR